MATVVLAYSGGLDTSIMIPWLIETYNLEVIALCVDIGQGDIELSGLREKALKSGARECIIDDAKAVFVTEYLYPLIKSGAVYESDYLLGTSIARPLIAKRMVDIARAYNADAVAHGATGKGNDQVRFEVAFMALAPDLKIIAPWKDTKWDLTSREACLAYAAERDIPVSQSTGRLYSEDANLWHISHEGGVLESAESSVPDDVYTHSQVLSQTPDAPSMLTLRFEAGVPVQANDHTDPLGILTYLNKLGGEHGIGQVDMIENRVVGMKSRGVYETPGGTLIYTAHRALEQLVLDRSVMLTQQKLALEYASLIYDGRWFSPLRVALDAFFQATQEKVSGSITLSLYKGHARVHSRQSDYSLYNQELASFTDSELYNQADATGFIKLYGLSDKLTGIRDRG